MTHDVDIVIDPSALALAAFVRELQEAGFYVDDRVAGEALRRRRMFNAIRVEDAAKIDLIVRKDRPFSVEELSRRRPVVLVDGVNVQLASPEDTILAKLEWARRAGGSEKQLADVAGVLDVHRSRLDRGYIERWVTTLGVADLWTACDRGNR